MEKLYRVPTCTGTITSFPMSRAVLTDPRTSVAKCNAVSEVARSDYLRLTDALVPDRPSGRDGCPAGGVVVFFCWESLESAFNAEQEYFAVIAAA